MGLGTDGRLPPRVLSKWNGVVCRVLCARGSECRCWDGAAAPPRPRGRAGRVGRVGLRPREPPGGEGERRTEDAVVGGSSNVANGPECGRGGVGVRRGAPLPR